MNMFIKDYNLYVNIGLQPALVICNINRTNVMGTHNQSPNQSPFCLAGVCSWKRLRHHTNGE